MRSITQQANHTLVSETHGPGFTDITREIAHWLEVERAGDGLLTVFVAYTSAFADNPGKRRPQCAARS